MRLRAMAKINLGLDVVRKREDGYHEVRMIMQTIRMYDSIELTHRIKPGIQVMTNLRYLPVNEDNLVYRAAKLLMDEFQIKEGVLIRLEKFIPVAAGMAGGSADAAASQQPGADAADSSESQSGGNQASSAASKKPEEQKNNGSGIPSTKAEILNYLNTSLNNAKKAKPGYKKHHVMQAKGNVSGIPSWLVNLVTKDKTTTMAKGGDNTDDFPAAGFAWSSKLTVNDIKDASLKQNGDNYEITVKLGTEKNPSKGTGSSYGKVMSVIDANEAA